MVAFSGDREMDQELKRNSGGYGTPRRIEFPERERQLPWLPLLLDAYFEIDRGIAKALQREADAGRVPACAKGCSVCCGKLHDIPVYPLELAGLTWYATERVSGAVRDAIKRQLRGFREGSPCPFLVDRACAVHPLRPMGCRQFMVFGSPCAEGEDPYHSRRGDVLTPIQEYADRAAFIMLPFYGVGEEADRQRIIESGGMRRMVTAMHTCNWESLARRMDIFDERPDHI